jgi:hypothetical protein
VTSISSSLYAPQQKCARSSFVQLVDGFLNGVGQLPASLGSMDALWRPGGEEAMKRHTPGSSAAVPGRDRRAWEMPCWAPPETTDRELSQPADSSWMWHLGYDVWDSAAVTSENFRDECCHPALPWGAAACEITLATVGVWRHHSTRGCCQCVWHGKPKCRAGLSGRPSGGHEEQQMS